MTEQIGIGGMQPELKPFVGRRKPPPRITGGSTVFHKGFNKKKDVKKSTPRS